jgi:hypothetical protein
MIQQNRAVGCRGHAGRKGEGGQQYMNKFSFKSHFVLDK